MDLQQKLQILADAAKYDVSCSSSGSSRKGAKGSLGNAANFGICHSFTPDGRCVSLLKILLSNNCSYDCAYCVNRSSNDLPRATFTVDEVAELTINFYRRNYIEGLFLSSAILGSPNRTMELLTEVVRKLRTVHRFGGYIHLKAIPGADPALISQAGHLVDRMSVNIELPSSQSLQLLAPDKHRSDILAPMNQIRGQIAQNHAERRQFRKAPVFVPAGQSTQMIVGASDESDLQILTLASSLYDRFAMKRVYYSAYVPINQDKKLPALIHPPTVRENRLYQCDWLMRFYHFRADELLDQAHPHLDMALDPKTVWALRHPEQFPVEINTAPYQTLLRIPGIGVRGAQKIVQARQISRLAYEDLKKMGLQMKRAQYFILCGGKYSGAVPCQPETIRQALLPPKPQYQQLTLFPDSHQQMAALTGEF